jgi:hypothetical protein
VSTHPRVPPEPETPEPETPEPETHRIIPRAETQWIIPGAETQGIILGAETHRIVLRFRPNISEARKRELMTKYHLTVPEGDTLFFTGSVREAAQLITALRAEDDIAAVALGA